MRCPSLAELPPPTEGRTGWPWTVETPQLPPTRADGSPWPRISIVTPSYNQGQFIEETIRSILLQGYPDLEYIIMDGGSTDDSVAIIRKYEPWLSHWVSEKDEGQVDAINKGFSQSTGRLLNWINSDDLLLGHSLENLGIISGLADSNSIISGARLRRYARTEIEVIDMQWALSWPLFVLGFPDFPQDSTFFTYDLWLKAGPLDARFNYRFDTAFHARAMRNARQIIFSAALLSIYRMHSGQKTTRYDSLKIRETAILHREYVLTSLPRRAMDRLLRTRFTYEVQCAFLAINRRETKKYRVASYDIHDEKWCLLPIR